MATAVQAPISTWKLGLALGLLSALGPVAIDLYLPAFPTIVHALDATPGEVQRTLSVFLLALAFAQIPIGSFGDRFGRRLPLLLGLGLYVVASLACTLATRVEPLIALRFVQGFAVCAGTACSRAMIRDLKTGHEAARLMAVSFLIIGISPILAPLLGSALLRAMPWQGLFVLLAGMGVAGIIVTLLLPESLPAERRVPRGTPILPAYGALLGNPRFIAGAVVAGLATTIPYAYVTAAPFVYSGLFALKGGEYSLLLALNAGCSIATTQVSPNLMKRWGPRNVLIRISAAGLALTTSFAALIMSGQVNLISFQLFSMAIFALAGLLLTPAAISALDAGTGGAGAAAGLLGALQLAVTALASAVVTIFPAFSLAPLVTVLGGALTLALMLSLARKPA
jgi:DHA1 family bicyclomycin/chloramphenicol resistance-like MFS transporter